MLKNYKENFDYKNEREYLDELLASEVLAETVFLHELPRSQYALDVTNPQLLLRANLDALRGYIENLVNHDWNSISRYKERFLQANEPNSFYCASVQLDYDCHLGINSVVLENCNLGNRSRFSDSVLFPSCVVGPQTDTSASLLSREVQVGRNCIIKNSYIGKGAVIGDDCRLVNCLVEENTTIDNGKRFEGLQLKNNKETLPFNGTAAFRKTLLEDDDELDFGEPEEESESEAIDPQLQLANFTSQVKKYIFDGFEEGEETSKIFSEISFLKLDMNMEFTAWISATTTAVYEHIKAQTVQQTANRAQRFDEILKKWKPLFEPFQREANQLEILRSISTIWCEEKGYTVLIGVQLAYKHDIVTRDSIIEWHNTSLDEALKPKFKDFYTYLSQQDEDSSEEDDSSGSDKSSSKD